MAEKDIKLAYLPGMFAIKATVPVELCEILQGPPQELLGRAKSKFDKELASKNIAHYYLNIELFQKAWVAAKGSKSDFSQFNIIVGQGSPLLKGLVISPVESDKAICTISIPKDPKSVSKWLPEWIVATIASKMNIKDPSIINKPQIYAAIKRAAAGVKVENYPIAFQKLGRKSDKPFTFAMNKARKELTLNIFDPTYVDDHKVEIFTTIDDTLEKIKAQIGDDYEMLDEHVENYLESNLTGPELFGVNLPISILAAMVLPTIAEPVQKESSQPNIQDIPQADSPKHKRVRSSHGLTVEVSEDLMSAFVTHFDMGLYADDNMRLDKSWMIGELLRMGFKQERFEPFIKIIESALKSFESLEGLQVAIGEPGQGGLKPYIYDSYTKAFAKQVNLEKDKMDIRSAQQRKMVKQNQLIAEIRYEIPPQMGVDVFGTAAMPTDNEDIVIHLGQGVEERKPGRYYAAFDGMPQIKRNRINLNRIMIHDGDVNLRSGNINFDGPVEIRGNVDNGASIYATGDINVLGNVAVAQLKSGGSIIVNGGIVTTEEGSVFASNDIRASFIENSKLRCGGDLYVQKAILNSYVIAGGSIQLRDKTDGLVAGGSISCFDHISTGKLGFKTGNFTELNLGVDWISELSCAIRRGRIQKLEDVQQKDRASLREVMDRQKKNVKTKKLDEQKKLYQERLQRVRVIIEKAQAHLKEAEMKVQFNNDAFAKVHSTGYPNISIKIAGHSIKFLMEMTHIAIVGRKTKKGSNVVALEEFLAKEDDGAA